MRLFSALCFLPYLQGTTVPNECSDEEFFVVVVLIDFFLVGFHNWDTTHARHFSVNISYSTLAFLFDGHDSRHSDK